MELIKEIKSKREKNGKLVKWGKFLCTKCGTIVEKRLSNGIKAKSCGCNWHNFSDEHKNNISISLKGKKKTEEHKQKVAKTRIEKGVAKGENNPMYGKKHTEETKNKQSKIKKGKYLGQKSPMYGKKHTNEAKEKISKKNKGKLSGENNPSWEGGKSFEEYPQEFYLIRDLILKRDNYICQDPRCEHRTSILDVHHIDFNKKNNSSENLTTLCHNCHAKTFGKKNKQYWIEFYQNIMMGKIMECFL